MTTGEIIQYHRKRLSMSQEDLGQKLIVSRQTISQWEKGQTVPTTDNLIRLKEIFGVSVDELLGLEAIAKKNTPEPELLERYEFSFSDNEIAEIQKSKATSFSNKMIIFFTLISLFLAYSIFNNTYAGVSGFLVGVLFVFSVLFLQALKRMKKASINIVERIPKCVYIYKTFDEHFTLEITKNGETVQTQKVLYSSIEQVIDYKTHIELLVNGQLFPIKKDVLNCDSAFLRYKSNNPLKVKVQKSSDKHRVISILLFIITLLTLYIGMGLVALLDGDGLSSPKYMWVFYILTPIPIASIVYGYFLKRKGYKYLKNVIAGFIVLGLCCAFGSFSFIFKNMYSENDKLILQAEQVMDIDIPQYRSIATQDLRMGTSTDPNRKTQFVTKVRFNDVENIQLLKEIKADDRWLSTMPNDVYYIASASYIPAKHDYVVTYNSDTDEYNTVPQDGGTYDCICIMYCSVLQELTIEEYTLTYTK